MHGRGGRGKGPASEGAILWLRCDLDLGAVRGELDDDGFVA